MGEGEEETHIDRQTRTEMYCREIDITKETMGEREYMTLYRIHVE